MTPPRSPSTVPALRIGDVAERLGVTTSVLRAWERRHHLVDPQRTAGGQRLYSEADVALLRRFTALVEQGWALEAAAAEVRSAPPRQEPSRAPEAPLPSERAMEAQRTPVDDRSGRSPTPTRRTTAAPVPSGPAHGDQGGGPTAVMAPEQVATTTEPGADTDVVAMAAAHETLRAMIRARSEAAVVAALVTFAESVGAEVGPAALESDGIVPIDVGLGWSEPLLPRAEPYSLARMRIEAFLPGLVEDARAALARLAARPDDA